LLSGMAAHSQGKRVSAQDSQLLLLAPYLEDVTPNYQYFGWNVQGSVETAYVGVARANKTAGRAQVYLNVTAPLYYWRIGTSLDEAWVRKSFAFFKDKTVQITTAAAVPGPFVRTMRFEVEGGKCFAFELRYVTNDVGAQTITDRQSITGIYCPPSEVVLDDALIQRVFEGIFVRRDGRIERALRGVDKPIPPQLLRGGQKQG